MGGPDLQIRGRGGGGGYPDPEISGGGAVSKKLGKKFWSKNKVGEGALPWIRHCSSRARAGRVKPLL